VAGGPEWDAALRYRRDAVLAGDWQRLLTGHLAHAGWPHLGLNLAVLWLIAGTLGRHWSVLRWTVVTFTLALLLYAAVLVMAPEMTWHRGLPGLLHGLLAPPERLMPTRRLLLAAVAGKLAWEQAAGAVVWPTQTLTGPIAVDAHLFGFICGVAYGLGSRWLQRLVECPPAAGEKE